LVVLLHDDIFIHAWTHVDLPASQTLLPKSQMRAKRPSAAAQYTVGTPGPLNEDAGHLLKDKFCYAILVAGRSEAGRRPAAS